MQRWIGPPAPSIKIPFLQYDTEHLEQYLSWAGNKPRGDEHFRGRVSKFSINFEEILLRAHRNFQDQNNILELFIIIINCCIIINEYYNYIV